MSYYKIVVPDSFVRCLSETSLLKCKIALMPTHADSLLPDIPLMLSIAGHDPCGGAGIQADAESAASLGVHAATIITCLTIQDTANVYAIEQISPEILRRQFETLAADLRIESCKIGLIGFAETAELLAELLDGSAFPLVLDPVLAAGGGADLASAQLEKTIRHRLIPMTTLITPNLPEARRLTGQLSSDDCAAELIQNGCANVLITGGHDHDDTVINQLYDHHGLVGKWEWPRLPGDYHGTGCTLSSAIAALLAKGVELYAAVEQAQRFTQQTLLSAVTMGHGQRIPKRISP